MALPRAWQGSLERPLGIALVGPLGAVPGERASDDVKTRIHADGGDPLVSTPEEYAADIDREEAKWSALLKKLGMRVE